MAPKAPSLDHPATFCYLTLFGSTTSTSDLPRALNVHGETAAARETDQGSG